jgi:membrane protein YdbS with pleckstrin-like domain
MPSIDDDDGRIRSWVRWLFRVVWLIVAVLVVAGVYLVGWSPVENSLSLAAICWNVAMILLVFFSPQIIND